MRPLVRRPVVCLAGGLLPLVPSVPCVLRVRPPGLLVLVWFGHAARTTGDCFACVEELPEVRSCIHLGFLPAKDSKGSLVSGALWPLPTDTRGQLRATAGMRPRPPLV